ncbi:hypothetical protein VP141O351_P0010 [Vibrio phage 141O35-1]|nr:hypothetical protein VP141O351_P0010 [Vibrio phage 141O35-1]
MDFNEWLDSRLDEDRPDWYDPNGNSPHAVLVRMRKGYILALRYECKEVLRDIRFLLFKEFCGFETPILWFAQVVLLPILLPFAPFIRTYFRHRRALEDFKDSYLSQHP